MRILIIGAGASGMMAALSAAQHHPDASITVLERHSRAGRKLAATGNGRCNLTNLSLSPANYHGEDPAFSTFARATLPPAQTRQLFANLGLITKEEPGGRVYPYSDQASSVVDVLRLSMLQAGVTLQTGAEVQKLFWKGDAFFARTEETLYAADRVIVACGGEAGQKLGGTDLGYRLLAGFGHSSTPRRPCLVQLRSRCSWVHALKGIRAACRMRILQGETELAAREGEVQFTEHGLSGIVAFELSRYVQGADQIAELDLLPAMPCAKLQDFLQQKAARFSSLPLEDFLTGTVQNRLGRTLLTLCGYRLNRACGTLQAQDFERISRQIKCCHVPLDGTLGMEQAQVTRGGMQTDQFDPETLQSRLCPGLYACGEVLDVDGDCGGFNLQWAWSSGYLAGQLKGERNDSDS